MRRSRVLLPILALLSLGGVARADQLVQANQRFQGFQADGLHDPTTSKSPATAALRLGDVAVCAGIPWSIGVNGAFRCSVPGTDFLSSSNVDGVTIGISATNLQRLALTFSGAITGTMAAGSGSLTTAFGTAGAHSVLMNATGSTAVPTYVGPATSGQFLGDSGWGLVPTLSLTGTLQAAQSPAYSGAITTTAGSLVTAFGTQAGLSLFGVTGSSTAVPAPIVASVPYTVPMLNSAGTSVAWSAITPASTSGMVATWDPSVYRVYAIDYDAGNDASAGAATAASSSLADFEAADAAAGAVALKTMQGLGQIIPRQGAGRKIAIIIASRSGGTSYLKQDGVTVDSLDSFMTGTVGYSQILIWATGTNATCGATKFTGDAADFTCAGGIIVPGTNSSGYHPTAGASTTTVPATKVGGGAPGLASEPLAPLGYSTRFDVGTTTSSLRNIARGTQIVSTTSTTNDTVSPQAPWPATPTTSDTFYLEQPGVVCNGWGANWDINSRVSIVGIRALTLTNYSPGPTEISSLKHMFDGLGGSTALGTVTAGIIAISAFDPGTGVGTITRGSTIHIAGAITLQPGTFPQLSSVVTEGQSLFEFMQGGFEDRGSVFGGTLIFQGMNASLIPGNPFLGNVTPGPTQIQDRVIAGHVVVDGGSLNLRDVQITGTGAIPAISVVGVATVYLGGPTGSTGNTDVGLDLTGATGARVIINSLPTVTGTAGDVRLADGTIITWAQANAGVMDSAGNQITGTATFPITVTPAGTTLSGGSLTVPSLVGPGHTRVTSGGLFSVDSGTYLLDPTCNGIVVRTASGTTTCRTLTNTDGTVTFTNPDGVAGNPVINTTGLVPATRTATGTAPIAIAGDHAAHDWSANRTWSLDANGVTNSFLAQMGAGTIKGNNTGGTANALDLTATQVTAMLNPFTSSLQGLAPSSGGGTTNFLRADGTWAAPTGAGVPTTRTLTMTAPMTCDGGGSCDLSANRTIATPVFAGSSAGLVPSSAGGTSNFLRADGTYAVPPGTGGGGTVTSVSATAPLFITGGASPTPNVTIQGSIVTGSTNTAPYNLGALASGLLKQSVAAGISTIAIAAAGTDYSAGTASLATGPLCNTTGTGALSACTAGNLAAAQTWPATTDVLVSAGTTSAPVGDSSFTFDTTAHVLSAGNAVQVNGASPPANVFFIGGPDTNNDRDRVQFFLGAGSLGATGTGDNTLFDLVPIGSNVRSGVTNGRYSTERIRSLTYTGGSGQSILEASSLYIDDAPASSSLTVSSGKYALHVAAGQSRFDGTMRLSGVPGLGAGTGIALLDSVGDVSSSGVLGAGLVISDGSGGFSTSAGTVMFKQDYYVDIPAASLNTTGFWVATSTPSLYTATAVEYTIANAVTAVHPFLTGVVLSNPIIGGTVPQIQIWVTKNGSRITAYTHPVGLGDSGAFVVNFAGGSSFNFNAGDTVGVQIRLSGAVLNSNDFISTISFGWEQ